MKRTLKSKVKEKPSRSACLYAQTDRHTYIHTHTHTHTHTHRVKERLRCSQTKTDGLCHQWA
jgi:hypothetical protein